MNIADYIIKKLEELGVNDFFGIREYYNFSIINAVAKNNNTNFINCTTGLNSGYCADGYARIRGYGAVITSYGAGELSVINAVAGAYAENVPIAILVGFPTDTETNNCKALGNNLNNPDFDAFLNAYKNVTEDAVILNDKNTKQDIDRVLSKMVKERKPVYIAIPSDIAIQSIDEEYVSYDWQSDDETLHTVTELIAQKFNSSSNPVILGDVLIKRFNSEIEYKEFASKTGAPVTNFIMGQNLIDMENEKYIGGYFSDYKNPIAQKYTNDTDCLISVGAVYSNTNSFGCDLPFCINNHIAIYGTYTYVDGIKYDNVKMSDVLEKTTELIDTKNIVIDKPNIGLRQQTSGYEPLTSSYVYSRLQSYFKENDIIFCESGSTLYGLCQMKLINSVNVEYQAYWKSLGWATPTILGACTANPGARIILLTGDTAHQNSAMEVGNLLKLGYKPVIIVINNKGDAVNKILMSNNDEFDNKILNMNYSKFARVFEGDIWATKTSTSDDFDKALKVTQIMNKMCYIEADLPSMETPNLAQEAVKVLSEKQNKPKELFMTTKPTEASNSVIKEKTLEDYQSSDNSFAYETIVHRSLKNDG